VGEAEQLGGTLIELDGGLGGSSRISAPLGAAAGTRMVRLLLGQKELSRKGAMASQIAPASSSICSWLPLKWQSGSPTRKMLSK